MQLTFAWDTETEAEFYARLRTQPITVPVTETVVDWGTIKGQGKRSNGMVRGSMADPPRGPKTYRCPFAALPDYAEIHEELGLLRDLEVDRYLRARSAGLCHEGAMRWVYELAPENRGVTWRWYRKGD